MATKWLGRCPECNGWNTFAEEDRPAAHAVGLSASAEPVPLGEVGADHAADFQQEFRFAGAKFVSHRLGDAEGAAQNAACKHRHGNRSFHLRRASFAGSGLQPEFADGSWDRIRERIYQGHGS